LHIIDRYKRKLLNYIIRISGFRLEEAEDVLQDVFIKVYRNLNDFDASLKFSSWIFRIAHNEAISAFRKNKIRPHFNALELNDEIANKIASDFDIKKRIDEKLLRQKVDQTLSDMDQKYREVIVLKFLEEKDYREISDIIKKPMGTVASLMNRAKKEFKKRYIIQD